MSKDWHPKGELDAYRKGWANGVVTSLLVAVTAVLFATRGIGSGWAWFVGLLVISAYRNGKRYQHRCDNQHACIHLEEGEIMNLTVVGDEKYVSFCPRWAKRVFETHKELMRGEGELRYSETSDEE